MKYDTIAEQAIIDKTIESLKSRNFNAVFVATKDEALSKIKEMIPAGASVMNGASKTLEEIGFVEYLKSGNHGWNNLHEKILAENDPAKQAELRKQSVLSEWYLGSVHALSTDGQMVVASNSGSQLPHLVFTSRNIILVVGGQKITADLNSATERLENYVIPLEDVRAMGAYGAHTANNKTLIIRGENPMMKRNVTVILVGEKLGF